MLVVVGCSGNILLPGGNQQSKEWPNVFAACSWGNNLLSKANHVTHACPSCVHVLAHVTVYVYQVLLYVYGYGIFLPCHWQVCHRLAPEGSRTAIQSPREGHPFDQLLPIHLPAEFS